MNGWKAIETAPKFNLKEEINGKGINKPLLLIRKDTGEVTVGEYRGPFATNYPNHEWADLLQLTYSYGDYEFERIEATYWMHFPEPLKE
jgi:hypothetical protein